MNLNLALQVTVFEIVDAIAALRDAADGGLVSDAGIGNSTAPLLVPANGNALAYQRTPLEVCSCTSAVLPRMEHNLTFALGRDSPHALPLDAFI